MFKKIDHVEIIPADFERCINFYTDVLGFSVRQRNKAGAPPMKEIAYLELNGTVAEVISVENPSPVPADPWQVGYRMIALEVDDMDKAIEYLKSKDVEISRPPMTLGKSKRAEFKDSEGLSIELRQW
ncbi:MAG: VOC family protein [Chloroflexi bacterium]|nr:VOC family protein [Chloroflexota bacterium]